MGQLVCAYSACEGTGVCAFEGECAPQPDDRHIKKLADHRMTSSGMMKFDATVIRMTVSVEPHQSHARMNLTNPS